MLYEAYVKKIARWAQKRDAVLKYKVPIIIALALVLAALAGFIATKGMLLGDMQYSAEITYGDDAPPSVKAFLGEPYYEYAAVGSDAWSEEYPSGVGSYKVRAVSARSFGFKSYSDEFAFVIKPVKATVTASESEIIFGSQPTPAGNLQYEDKIQWAEFNMSSTVVGESTVSAIANTIKVFDKNGKDVTNAYVFETPEKTVQIVKKIITITLDDATKEYDGKALVCKTYQSFDDQLLSGHTGKITLAGERVDAGVTMNSVATFEVFDGQKNVTENYGFTTVGGALTVSPRKITIITGSASKEYDGKALTTDVNIVSSGKLLRNHGIKVDGKTEAVDAGVYDNELNIVICDRNNKNADVSANYSITYKLGKLTVSPRRITIKPLSITREYDGTPLFTTEAAVVSSTLVKGHNVVLETTQSITDVGSVENEITKYTFFDGANDVTANYNVKCQTSTLTVTKRQVVVKPLDVVREYDATQLKCNQPEFSAGSLAEGQTMELTANGAITNVGAVTNTILGYRIFGRGGEDVTANYNVITRTGSLIVKKRAITVTAASNSKVYDATPLSDGGYSVTAGSVVEGQILTVTVEGTRTNAGETENRITSWRITTDTYQNVSSNYAVTLVSGMITINPRPITVKAADAQKMYDSEPLYSPGYSIEAGTLVKGQKIALVTTVGSQTDVGSSLNTVDNIKIVDAKNADVTVNYAITLVDGTLTVTPRLITIRPTGGTKVYDGTRLVSAVVEVVSAVKPVEGHMPVLATNSELAGYYNYDECTPYIVMNYYDTSMTSNYEITVLEGAQLYISKFEFMVKPLDAEKVYDGTPLTSNSPELVTPESIPEGHLIEITTSGSLTDVRYNGANPTPAVNRIKTVVVKNAKGEDVTSCFDITTQFGTLLVTPRPVTVKPSDEVKEYDGTPLTGDTPEVTDGSLAEGQTATLTTDGSQTEIGSSGNAITEIVIKDATGKNVTKNYIVTTQEGTLTVTKRALVIAPADVEKIYDGNSLEPSDMTIVSGTLLDGHEVYFSLGGTRTEAGVTPSFIVEGSAVVRQGHRDVTGLYDLKCVEGAITVTPRPITVVFKNNTKVYDGEVFFCDEYVISSDMTPLVGHTLYIETLLPSAGEYGPDGYAIKVFDGETEKTANYAITYESTVTITKRPITFTITSIEKEFDGERLMNTEVLPTVSDALVTGHTVAAVTYGAAPAAYSFGHAETPFLVLIFTAENMGEGQAPVLTDFSNNYEISVLGAPTLTIKHRRLVVKAETLAQKIYDGTPVFDASVFIASGELPEGHSLVHENIGGVNVGVYNGLLREDLKVVDLEGVDLTEHYEIVMTGGSSFGVEIIPMTVDVNIVDSQKEYDGTADFDATALVSTDTPMLEGHRLIIKGENSGISTESVYTENYAVYDALGNDMTGNYLFNFSDTKFKVETVKRSITIKPVTVSRPYNGQPLYGSDRAEIVSLTQLVEGHTIKIETSGSQTMIGEGVLTVTKYTITDANGVDVTANYDVTCEEGTVRVMKMNLVLATSSASAVYTGDKLSARGVTIFIGSLLEGHTIYDAEAVYAEVSNVGNFSNTVSGIQIHDADGNDVTDLYYKLSYKYGTLTIIEA